MEHISENEPTGIQDPSFDQFAQLGAPPGPSAVAVTGRTILQLFGSFKDKKPKESIINDTIEKLKQTFTVENINIEEVLAQLENFKKVLPEDTLSSIDLLAYTTSFPIAVNIIMMYTDKYIKKDLMGQFAIDSYKQEEYLKSVSTKTQARGTETSLAFEKLLHARKEHEYNYKPECNSKIDSYIVVTELMEKVTEIIEVFQFIVELDKYKQNLEKYNYFVRTFSKKAEQKLEIFNKIQILQEQAKQWEKLTGELSATLNVMKTETKQEGDISDMRERLISNVSSVIGSLPISSIEKDLKISGSILSLLNSLNPIQLLSKLDWTCPVCLCKKPENITALKTCGHLTCDSCLANMTKCPVCRHGYTKEDHIKIYL